MPETFEFNNRLQRYYSLKEIALSIKSVITRTYNDAYWVKAEIVKLNYYPYSGHCYPDLVEKQNNKIIAQMRATIWSGQYQAISSKFKSVTGVDITEGMTVLFLAKVTYHELYGLSLNIIDIEPAFTLGEMARDKKEAIERLKKEGLYNKNKSLSFPLLPKNIAVISVETSKGYHDFLEIINNNRYGYHFEHVLFQALLQGDGAVDSITSQLKKIAENAVLFDVVVIIRGGGGDVGLNAYDNYKLASAVADFPLPIITGIGHSTNETVTEMVAYVNKITPTDVAYFLIEKFENFHAVVEELTSRLLNATGDMLEKNKTKLDDNASKLKSSVSYLVEKNKSGINLFSEMLKNNVKSFVLKNKNNLNELSSHLRYRPVAVVISEKEKLIRKTEKLNLVAKQLLKNKKAELDNKEIKLNLLKPENVIKRGYSITYLNGNIVKSVTKINKGDRVVTKLNDGDVYSIVDEVKRYEQS
jgi:exodeoxyribonuclease VII large subunit